ncbi:helix-turn-helix domain-containing protein [Paenibacillus terreus]|uniref:Helix-turn-helix domain-containing protein n=1 Tax=Paenibacillus terreus TaxID=1387834 RepID=A0ABV5B3L4_9BACL
MKKGPHRQGQSSRAIAKELGRHPSTIWSAAFHRNPITQSRLRALMRSVVKLLSHLVNGPKYNRLHK